MAESLNPCCFKGVKNKPCLYRALKKDLFEKWVRERDRKFQRELSTALIVDNCPAHLDVNDLKAKELVFLPPNTTSYVQPKDQGVIWSLKSKYSFVSQAHYYCI